MLNSFFTHLTLLSAIPGLDLPDLITWAGVAGVIMIIFAETGLLIGFFLPGDSLLFTAGFLVYAGILKTNIHLFVLLLFIAAVAGDSVGYTFGRKVGRKVFDKPDSKIFKQSYLLQAEAFYAKHGGKTIILARFIPIVRTFAPVVAGTAKMKYRTFFMYNVIGGFIWTAGLTYLGYMLGSYFTSIGMDIDQVILPIVAVIILLSITPPIVHLLKDKDQRGAIWSSIKYQIKTLLKRK